MEDMDFIFAAVDHLKNKGYENVFNIVKQENGDNYIPSKERSIS